jgi:hypothetical protein
LGFREIKEEGATAGKGFVIGADDVRHEAAQFWQELSFSTRPISGTGAAPGGIVQPGTKASRAEMRSRFAQ